ncbi:prepilin peptidase [Methylocystis sp. JAN1]|uniref:prepilin peptidase n=1 Tax=Methylocystis sp. JAN1 TaxID=3397211 RepID=UPI003FA29F72
MVKNADRPNFRLTLTAAACRRRRRALAPLARDILLARGDGRPLAPAAWTAIFSLLAHLAEAPRVGYFLAPGLLLFVGLCLIALFDARYFVIPDGPLAALGLCGVAVALANAPLEAPARLAAAAAAYVALRLVDLAYESLRGAAGVGQGDARLFALAGLWLGFPGLPGCLIYGVLSALLSVVLAMRQGTHDSARQPIPFGPHLALGFWLVWVFGPLETG